MRRAGVAVVAAVVALVLAAGALVFAQSRPAPPEELPVAGTQLGEFPDGPMKAVADQACLRCHSTDMIRQQRLTEKQWTAAVEKMMRWGAPVENDADKSAIIAYLSKHYGPENRFAPTRTAPVK